jgi:hypothetical protein
MHEILKELKDRIPDLKPAELVNLANGMLTRLLCEIFRRAASANRNLSAQKIQALVLGDLVNQAGDGKRPTNELVAKMLRGHEGGDLLGARSVNEVEGGMT